MISLIECIIVACFLLSNCLVKAENRKILFLLCVLCIIIIIKRTECEVKSSDSDYEMIQRPLLQSKEEDVNKNDNENKNPSDIPAHELSESPQKVRPISLSDQVLSRSFSSIGKLKKYTQKR